MDSALMIALATTFFFVSITPGMCMTLALTLGMTVGVRRTMWMMAGELIGVGLVALLAIIGVAALLLQYPPLFYVLKYGGGAYLAYLGVQLWQSKGALAIDLSGAVKDTGRWQLAIQGAVTAVANPKAWAFTIAILPPFVEMNKPLPMQLAMILVIVLSTELVALLAYATGGKSLGKLLQKNDNVRVMNRIAGTLMLGVAVWLVLG
ncbi:MAG: LysE family translocator [Gammaproteobacteria bacterium]|mgnify:FL=1|jgi:threonine/homoserine/homoserine lactone efflux protein|nr:LysE family translocator [Gammaproteobacteria bacterium]MCP4880898.1 LysE family translocator [Gammaproteobacteria bacterium]MDP6164516.1 LysE family translocator [Gammaproteobacteria bacterium]